MGSRKSGSRSGGPGGAAGYNYQARCYAFFAAHILSETSLNNWFPISGSKVPVRIAAEVRTGGDDLRIWFGSGITLDVQAKRKVFVGAALWEAIDALSEYVSAGNERRGVLLVGTHSALTIREVLAEDIKLIGCDCEDELREIGRTFLQRLKKKGLDPKSVCTRLTIQALDVGPGQLGEREAIRLLSEVLAVKAQASLAFDTLEREGALSTEGMLAHSAESLAILLASKYSLSPTTELIDTARAAIISWQKAHYSVLEIPPLGISLPMDEAWMRLSSINSRGKEKKNSLQQAIDDYHEWYSNKEFTVSTKKVEIETIVDRYNWLIILASPGAGKSTLSRRIAYSYAVKGELSIRVELKIIAALLLDGRTFLDAVTEIAFGSFRYDKNTLLRIANDTRILIADGLDEADPQQPRVAEELRKWASADPARKVIITSRPVGYQSNWFEEWEHYELLPLDWFEMTSFARKLLQKVSPGNRPEENLQKFIDAVSNSKTASLACRNPQLLTFLVSLHLAGIGLPSQRFDLFTRLLEHILETPTIDITRVEVPERTVAWRVMQLAAWEMSRQLSIQKSELETALAITLAVDLGITKYQAGQYVSSCLSFWERRRVLETISAPGYKILTFIHMSLLEFSMASYLNSLSVDEFARTVEDICNKNRYREAIVQLGGTPRCGETINLLISIADQDTLNSLPVILATELLAEASTVSDEINAKVANQLIQRLASSVPDEAFEAGEKLARLVSGLGEYVGELALNLQRSDQYWTKWIGVGLALKVGGSHVDTEVLCEIYPSVNPYGSRDGGEGIRMFLNTRRLMEQVLILGAEHLVNSGIREQLELVKSRFLTRHLPTYVLESMHETLASRLSESEMLAIGPAVPASHEELPNFLTYRKEEDLCFLGLIEDAIGAVEYEPTTISSEQFELIAKIASATQFGRRYNGELNAVLRSLGRAAAVEVLRGCIAACNIDQAQLKGGLALLSQADKPLYEIHKLVYDDELRTLIPEPDWSQAQDSSLDVEKLIAALKADTWFLSMPAACLLASCKKDDRVAYLLENALASGSGDTIALAAYAGQTHWGERTVQLIAERLEKKLTGSCNIVLREYSETLEREIPNRFSAIVRSALKSRIFELVEVSLSLGKKYGYLDIWRDELLTELRWWLSSGPLDPVGSGTVYPSAASQLYEIAIEQGWLGFEKWVSDINVRRKDVCKVLETHILKVSSLDICTFKIFINLIVQKTIPANMIVSFAKGYPEICRRYPDLIYELLNDEREEIVVSAIRAIAEPWSDIRKIEHSFREIMLTRSLSVRNEAFATLRRRIAV